VIWSHLFGYRNGSVFESGETIGQDGAVISVVIIVVVLVIAIPVAVLVSAAVGAGVLGWLLTEDVNERHEGTEWVDLA
jgi:threonine/homoserine/homoserine lactone efflux protein